MTSNSRACATEMLSSVRQKLLTGEAVSVKEVFTVQIPDLDEHNNHPVGKVSLQIYVSEMLNCSETLWEWNNHLSLYQLAFLTQMFSEAGSVMHLVFIQLVTKVIINVGQGGNSNSQVIAIPPTTALLLIFHCPYWFYDLVWTESHVSLPLLQLLL